MSEDDDRFEVGADAKQREVYLYCGRNVFHRCLEALQREGVLDDVDPSKAQTVVLWKGIPSKPSEKRARLIDNIALLGCATVAFIAILIFSIGIATIAGWF